MKQKTGYALIIAAIGATIYVRLSHPDMTETRLFIDFWYVWLAVVAVVFAGIWLLGRKTT